MYPETGATSWRELLSQLGESGQPPCVIIASRLADEHLWAEALNLGAYDVLAKPFVAAEVTRVLSSAAFRQMHSQDAARRAIAAGAGGSPARRNCNALTA